MKKAVIIIIVLFVLGFFLYQKAHAAVKRLDSDTQISSVNFSQTFQREGKLGLGLQLAILNDNNFQIPIQNLSIRIYYQNELVGIAQKRGFFLLQKQGITKLELPAVIYLRKNLLELGTELLKNEQPELLYQVEGKLFGFPIRITDQLLLTTENTQGHV